jgi:ATP-dependent DNA helicase RecQ
MIEKAQVLLKAVFGYDRFRPLQEEIIVNVLSGKDTLVIMPTGGGKSLCYQIPAMIFEGLTIVVSPLISLMKDQVEQLSSLGIPAAGLNSSVPRDSYKATKDRIRQGHIKLLYVAPETLLMPVMLSFLKAIRVACIAIDEAHCISEWGHEFRPEYRQLAAVRKRFPDAVCIALTATATPRVQSDIIHCLEFATPRPFIASFNRDNLFLQIVPKTDPLFQIMEFLNKYKDQSGIIYCFSRKKVDELVCDLTSRGFSAGAYHAGMEDDARKYNQEAFIRDDVQIMVATIAFGMGINKPNVRFVIHHDLPKNIESYYQQIGRAGRDGLRSHCLLLFSRQDLRKIRYFIDQKSNPERQVSENHLEALVRFAESCECRRKSLLAYFGEKTRIWNCGMCDNCLAQGRPLEDISLQARMFFSCVKRAGEHFGTGHIIDILRGSKSQKIMRYRHHLLKTYGTGIEFSRKTWRHYARQFIAQGFLIQDPEYKILKLTDRAWHVLKNEEPVMGTHSSSLLDDLWNDHSETDYPPDLLDLLRKRRKELADEDDVPPHLIVPDRTLIELASMRPQTLKAMRQIHGLVKIKLHRYGLIFFESIQCYLRVHPSNAPKLLRGEGRIRFRHDMKRRFMEIGEDYNQGLSIAALIRKYKIQQSAVLSHLYRYMAHGFTIRDDGLSALCSLFGDALHKVMSVFSRLGTRDLTPVYEALNGEIQYEELHLVRLMYMIRKTREANETK